MEQTTLNIDQIQVGERFREDYGNVEELAESIKEHGLIHPLAVDKDYKLIAGGRRFAALVLLGEDQVPVTVREATELERKEIELEENVRRKDMHYAEKVDALRRLHEIRKQSTKEAQSEGKDLDDWTMQKTSLLIGEAVGTISHAIDMSKAMEVMPDLRKCKNAAEAKRKLKKRLEGLAATKIIEEAQEKDDRHGGAGRFAETHYRISDAIAGLEGLSPGVVSFVDCDPPYGIDLNKAKRADDETDRRKNYDEIPRGEYMPMMKRVAELIYEKTAKDCWMTWWFGMEWYQPLYDMLTEVGWKVDFQPVIWSKGSGQTNQPAIHMARTYETFFVCRKGKPVMKEQGRANVFDCKPTPAAKKIHATEKPLHLMRLIIDTFAWPGSVIMVPFLGSGVTLRAAYLESSTGFGWDVSDKYKKGFIANVIKDSIAKETKED